MLLYPGNVFQLRFEGKIAYTGTGPRVGIRAIAGNLAVIARASAGAKRLAGRHNIGQHLLPDAEIRYLRLLIKPEVHGAAYPLINKMPRELYAAVLRNRRTPVVFQC